MVDIGGSKIWYSMGGCWVCEVDEPYGVVGVEEHQEGMGGSDCFIRFEVGDRS